MNPRLRTGIEILLVLGLLGIGIFAFYQYQLLTTSETDLASLSNDATALALQAASDLENAQNSATQSAAEAQGTSTENSNIIADNYAAQTAAAQTAANNQANLRATSSQAANAASTNIANVRATGTESFNQNAEANANFAATSTQSAANAASDLSAANATSTDAANTANLQIASMNATSTQVADDFTLQIANLNEIIADLDDDLASSREDFATQGAELDTANETIATQQGELESLRNGNTGNSAMDGFVQVQTSRFEMMVFDDYIVVNYEEDYQEAIDEIRDLGRDFDSIAEILDEENVYELSAVRRNTVHGEVMIITRTRNSDGATLADIVDSLVEYSRDQDLEIVDEGIVELGGQELGRIFVTSDNRRTGFANIYYILQEGRYFWAIMFTTDIPNAEDRIDDFDASVASFRLR